MSTATISKKALSISVATAAAVMLPASSGNRFITFIGSSQLTRMVVPRISTIATGIDRRSRRTRLL